MLPAEISTDDKIVLTLLNTVPHVWQCTGLQRKLTWGSQGPTRSDRYEPEHAFPRGNAGINLYILQDTKIVRKLSCEGQSRRGPTRAEGPSIPSFWKMPNVMQCTGLEGKLTWKGKDTSPSEDQRP